MTRAQSTQVEAEEVVKNGGVVIYWRPGCPFCERLDSGLGEVGDRATWVNIWQDDAAKAFVESVNNGNAVVPTVTTLERSFVASSAQAPKIVSAMIKEAGL